MQSPEKIINCYNTVADDYAAERSDELTRKHFDRLLLKEFALVNHNKGLLADFGCGPGQATKFLYDLGVKDIVGIDISPAMIEAARKLYPDISFATGNLLDLPYGPGHFSSAVAFYAIVHFTEEQVKTALCEINRVLKQGGQLLFSYHVGDETVHFDKAHDKEIDIDLYFFPTEKILAMLPATGFRVIDALERYPYKDAEYQTKRAYIWVEKE